MANTRQMTLDLTTETEARAESGSTLLFILLGASVMVSAIVSVLILAAAVYVY